MNDLEARKWLAYARSDLDAGWALLRDPEHFPRQVCFLAQQAAEKALKALLISCDIEFPRTHDLDWLRESIPLGCLVKAAFPQLYSLSIWAIESRYPSDMPDLIESDAKEALELAERIYQVTEEDFQDMAGKNMNARDQG